MSNFIIFDKTSGEILRWGHGLPAKTQIVSSNEDGIDAETAGFSDYVDTTTLTVKARPFQNTTLNKKSVIADGVDKVTLTNVPVNSIIVLGDITQIAVSPTIDLVFDTPGAYNLKVELFPYLPFEATINAT